jgi:hypothetical protein
MVTTQRHATKRTTHQEGCVFFACAWWGELTDRQA